MAPPQDEQYHPRLDGIKYEKLMRMVYPNGKSKRNGVDGYLMIRLLDMEQGQKHYRSPSHTKQVNILKVYLVKAITILIKKTDNALKLNSLFDIRDDLEKAYSSSGLIYTIDDLTEFLNS